MNKEIIRFNKKKIEKDIFNKDIEYYKNNGIFLEYDKENENIVYILYIIYHNNIYKHSQHLFQFEYTENYPFDPPKLTYLTARKLARLHPNFYSNGKCCLSLLGTWNGPGWTSCNNITSIINSIIPLFTDNPLQYEPTFENINRYKEYFDLYNLYISYSTIKLLIKNIDKSILNNNLTNIMKEYFMNNYKDIVNNIDKLKEHHNKSFKLPVYRYQVDIDYNELLEKCNRLQSKLNKI